MKLMKYILCALLLITTGCKSSGETKELKILCPTGAPSIAFTSIYDEVDITFVEGTDLLITEFQKDNSDYDIIVAPINLGAKLLENTMDDMDYRLDGILTWGNLYLVGTSIDSLQETGEIALIGEAAVPTVVYNASNIETTLTPVAYSSASIVQTQLLSGQAKVGLLAEPLVSATIAKAKQDGIELITIADMQEAYAKISGTEYGYPQAAIFAKKDTNISNITTKISDYINSNFAGIEENLEYIGLEKLGLPNTNVVINSLPRQNIKYVKANEVTNQISNFLQEFNITFDSSMLLND